MWANFSTLFTIWLYFLQSWDIAQVMNCLNNCVAHFSWFCQCQFEPISICSTNFVGRDLNKLYSLTFQVISGNLLFDFEDGHLISGTLDGLVDYLVPAADHFPEKSFIFAFILSSRIYIRPHQLLATVLHRAFLNRNVSYFF